MYQKPSVLQTVLSDGLGRNQNQAFTHLIVDVMAWDSPRYVFWRNENWNLSF